MILQNPGRNLPPPHSQPLTFSFRARGALIVRDRTFDGAPRPGGYPARPPLLTRTVSGNERAHPIGLRRLTPAQTHRTATSHTTDTTRNPAIGRPTRTRRQPPGPTDHCHATSQAQDTPPSPSARVARRALAVPTQGGIFPRRRSRPVLRSPSPTSFARTPRRLRRRAHDRAGIRRRRRVLAGPSRPYPPFHFPSLDPPFLISP